MTAFSWLNAYIVKYGYQGKQTKWLAVEDGLYWLITV